MPPSGLTVKEEMLYQQDDILLPHMWTLCIAMECCIHETPYQFDVKKKFMRIVLQHLSNRDGNPAKKNSLSTTSTRMTYQILVLQVKKN